MEQYNQTTQSASVLEAPVRLDTPSQRDYYRLLEQIERQARSIRRLESELAQLRDIVRNRQ